MMQGAHTYVSIFFSNKIKEGDGEPMVLKRVWYMHVSEEEMAGG